MTEIGMDRVIGQLQAVLREAFEGPADRWSYFTNNAPGSGWLGTLGGVTVEEVSRPIGGTTVAGHASHAAFALEATSAWIRGDRTPRDWAGSWRVNRVDESQWNAIVADLSSKYEDLARAIDSHAGTTEESMGGAIAAIAHAAYHLGAVRQKLAVIRQGVR